MSRRLRRWLWLPALLALAYLALAALLYANQRKLIYYPQYTDARAGDPPPDLSLPTAAGVQRGWVLAPGQRDAVIYFGGNAERVQDNRDDFQAQLPGRTVYLLPYRGYGGNPGTPSQQALVGDGLALYDLVRKRHPQGDIAVMGRSLGSGVASQVAAHRPVHALVLITPFDSLAAVAASHYRWLPVRWLVRDRYDSLAALQGFQGQVLILRAGRDAVVPPANTDQLVAGLAPPPHVVSFANAGHDDIAIQAGFWPAIAGHLRVR